MKRRQRVAYLSSFCIVIVVVRAFKTARNHRETVTKYLYTVWVLRKLLTLMVRNYVRKTDRGGWTEEQMKNAVVENKIIT
ncbi:unnamed protein product [Acanthoscelides obtectus]|uniref:Uncharacterized protein n=1 Tax=Acanthoscelides obtectus TaxID=200917 RepID=A0A9P0KB20_ACAOB|nr:unnamed protein product [Acanthoscelides obtectus]CAK1626323.1 hypothetical protein AOBTE_LOCUS3778 [Acanthoscelides obtectus]